MGGEYFLQFDPYNFDTEEEYLRFYYPELFKELDQEVTNGTQNYRNQQSRRLAQT